MNPVKRYGLFFEGGSSAWMAKEGHPAHGVTWVAYDRLYDSFDTQEEAKAEAVRQKIEKQYEIIDMRFWIPVYATQGTS